ncbi:unnamed protein product [Tuber aestivum]|uniref:G-patch domain-containing protein n=1 Tax=Tuber aestivum TaxID=59557 RepID=A0A292PTU2_9PEZI|nr:unnamed protein product [Tuber aestivum]
MSLKRGAPLNLSPSSPTSPPPPKRQHHKLTPSPSSPASSHTPPKQPPSELPPSVPAPEEDEEDDYMNMTIPDPTPTGPESYTERLKRKQRAAELAQPKSKTELARIEKQKRDEALAKSLLSHQSAGTNKGLKMMKRMGFTPGSGLGRKQWDNGMDEARLEPIGVHVKSDRGGIGLEKATSDKMKDAAAGFGAEQLSPEEYRERVRIEAEEARMEAQFCGAQKVCEKFEDTGDGLGGSAQRSVPLKSINVFWRGLVKAREEKERARKMKYEMLQSLDSPRLPGYDRDHELDHEDKVALGIAPGRVRKLGMTVEDGAEDEIDEDEELAGFDALGVKERLERIVEYLRSKHRYCFWCKYQYPDEQMEGCPGLEEDLHG